MELDNIKNSNGALGNHGHTNGASVVEQKTRSYYHCGKYRIERRRAIQIFSVSACLLVTVIGLSLSIAISVQGSGDNLHGNSSTLFFISCYAISVVFIIMVLVWGWNDTLNPDCQAKWKHANSMDFLKSGALVLGAGSIIYHALMIVEWMEKPAFCQNIFALAYYIMSVIFPLVQTYMIILYSKAEITGVAWWKEATSRIMFAFIMACNLCVWYQTLIFESQHSVVTELNKQTNSTNSHSTYSGEGSPARHARSVSVYASSDHSNNATNGTEHHDCSHGYSPYSDTFSPYLYPCTIEYSITCFCIILMMYVRVGGDKRRDSKKRLPAIQDITPDNHEGEPHLDHEIRPIVLKAENPYWNPRCGLFWCLMVVCITIIVVVVYLFAEYKDEGEVRLSSSISLFVLDIQWNLITMIMVFVALYRMKTMEHKTSSMRMKRFHREGRADRKPKSGVAQIRRNMDRGLLIISYMGLLVFAIFSMIATGYTGEWFMFFESLLAIFSGLTLTIAINWNLMSKRSTTTDHLRYRPGRQSLETIRGISLALWVLQTFAIRRNSAHKVQIDFFGLIPWSVVSHIFMPMSILFRFHAAVVISDVIKASYTGKYVPWDC